eukprot:TRINITY_DN11971_c0_g1_i2.p2 TRINITY_DN11971_c0_g1~~TRINITY_DN11971_c0_g1_i2.p2  ORF type:complete len:107 (+),score=27.84 TRINITY_DN11971_c0_g1_i2:66-386(+)
MHVWQMPPSSVDSDARCSSCVSGGDFTLQGPSGVVFMSPNETHSVQTGRRPGATPRPSPGVEYKVAGSRSWDPDLGPVRSMKVPHGSVSLNDSLCGASTASPREHR